MRTRLSPKGGRRGTVPPACGICSKQCRAIGSVEHDLAGGVGHGAGRRRRIGCGTICHEEYRLGMTDDAVCPDLTG